MACFIAPGVEAIVTTVATKMIEKKESEKRKVELQEGIEVSELGKEKLSTKLHRLNGLLWGGTTLLAFEHVWHGEVQPFFPFLTAASNAEDFAEMLHELSTIGVGMAVLITAIWGLVTWSVSSISKQDGKLMKLK